MSCVLAFGLSGVLAASAYPPNQSGEETAGREPSIVLHGRVLDEELVPVGDTVIDFQFHLRHPDSEHQPGQRERTTSDGGFHFEVACQIPADVTRVSLVLRAWWQDEASRNRLGEATAFIDFGATLDPGEHHLGSLVLVAPGSNTVLLRMSDDDLEGHYATLEARRLLGDQVRRDHETCLIEMARRGGRRWVEFLQLQLRLERARRAGTRNRAEDLGLLTALRRAQRLPDPLALELRDATLVEVVFPDLPVLAFEWKNVDPSETFTFTQGGSCRSGRFARCRIGAVDEAGRAMKPLPSPGRVRGGMSASVPLRPGDGSRMNVDLAQYVTLTHPGDYAVRIQYHDEESIASSADVRGWILSSSPTLTVRLQPRHVQLGDSERSALRGAIHAIDVEAPVPLTEEPWREDVVFQGEPASPEDRVFRSGWKAVPVLIEALDDQTMDPRRRAWILGLLWDLTGSNLPTAGSRFVLGAHRWSRTWRSEEVPQNIFLTMSGGSTEIVPEHQDELIARWREMRSCIVLD